MTIPGLPSAAGGGRRGITYSENANNVDVWSDMNSPSGIVTIEILVSSGVTIGSTVTSSSAMDISGFTTGSIITLINVGRIGGAGGNGGVGHAFVLTDDHAGGGGGGAGSGQVGVGGTATAPATVGANGLAATGGTAGVYGKGGVVGFVQPTSGLIGGDALAAGTHNLTIDNGNGEIWGGGGGGAGGHEFYVGGTSWPAQDGGDAGNDGDTAPNYLGAPATYVGGVAGFAIRGSGTITFSSGSGSPQLEGLIG